MTTSNSLPSASQPYELDAIRKDLEAVVDGIDKGTLEFAQLCTAFVSKHAVPLLRLLSTSPSAWFMPVTGHTRLDLGFAAKMKALGEAEKTNMMLEVPLFTFPQVSPLSETDAYMLGWMAAARWAKREDLISDIGSDAYASERDAALADSSAERSSILRCQNHPSQPASPFCNYGCQPQELKDNDQ
jgi:hypothetical protein